MLRVKLRLIAVEAAGFWAVDWAGGRMVIQAVGIAAIAAVEAAEVLRAGGEVALGGGAQYIRDGQPIGAVAQLGLGLARVACRRYGSNPGAYPSDTALNYEKACRPYLDDIGEGTGPGLALPFRGGQCPGVNYRISWTWAAGDFNSGPQEVERVGPLGFSREGTGSLDCGPGGGSYNVFTVTDGTGNSPVNLASGCDARITSLSVSRVDGQEDVCGNTEPEVRQPTGPTIVLPPIVPIFISPEFDVDAEVTVNIDGTVNIDIGTGPITIDPFGGNDDGGSGGDGGPDDSPPNPEPGPELPGGNGGFGGDDGFGEPPAGRRWVGCCITIVTRPTNQPPIPGSVPEDVYASVVGNVRLVYDASGTRQTDTPVRIQARKVCVWEAVRKLNPVGVRVDLQPGFGYVYRPYSVPLDA